MSGVRDELVVSAPRSEHAFSRSPVATAMPSCWRMPNLLRRFHVSLGWWTRSLGGRQRVHCLAHGAYAGTAILRQRLDARLTPLQRSQEVFLAHARDAGERTEVRGGGGNEGVGGAVPGGQRQQPDTGAARFGVPFRLWQLRTDEVDRQKTAARRPGAPDQAHVYDDARPRDLRRGPVP